VVASSAMHTGYGNAQTVVGTEDFVGGSGATNGKCSSGH